MVIDTTIGFGVKVKIVLKTKKDIETMHNILGKQIYAEFYMLNRDSKIRTKFIEYNKVSKEGKKLIRRIFKQFFSLCDCSYLKNERKEVSLALSRDKNIIRGMMQ